MRAKMNIKNKPYTNNNWLYQKYIVEKLSTIEIGKLCNCWDAVIGNWLKRHNIPVRPRGEANHLARGNSVNLSNEALEWINGELLGDGCLRAYKNYSAQVCYSSKYREYIDYIAQTLLSFGIKQSGKISDKQVIIYDTNRKKHQARLFKYSSLNYEELLTIYKEWYPNGKKIIPRNLKLSPITLRQHYIGDGSLKIPKSGNSCIVLHTNGFPKVDVEWLIKQINKLEILANWYPSVNSVYVKTCSVKDFLTYIGKCPVECYRYKWNLTA